jgi:hypothetical protein
MKSNRSWLMHTTAYALDTESVLPKKALELQSGDLLGQRQAAIIVLPVVFRVSKGPVGQTDRVLPASDTPFSMTDLPLSGADLAFSITDKTWSAMDQTFSVADKTLSMADQTFSMTDKPLSVADKTLSIADKTFSMVDQTFSVVDQTLSMTDKTFSVADQTPSMTDKTFSTAGMMGPPGNQPLPSSHHGTDSSHLGRHGRAGPASALGHARSDVGWICAAAHP